MWSLTSICKIFPSLDQTFRKLCSSLAFCHFSILGFVRLSVTLICFPFNFLLFLKILAQTLCLENLIIIGRGLFLSILSNSMKRSLCEKFPNTEFFWSVFSRIWTEYGDVWNKSPCSVRMRENTDQKNSVFRHFSHSGKFMKYWWIWLCFSYHKEYSSYL